MAYVPAAAGVVVAIDVDADDVPEVRGKPLKEVVARALGAPNWDVIEVLIGGELVAGTAGPAADGAFVAAIGLDDEDSMRGALDRAGYRKRAEERGADVFEGDGPPVAIEDGTLVIAASRPVLAQALLVRDGPAAGRFTRERLDRATASLPAGAPVRALLGPVGRLHTGGVTARSSGSEVALDADAAVAGRAQRVVPEVMAALRARGATVTGGAAAVEWRAPSAVLGALAERLLGLDPGPGFDAAGRVEALRGDRLRATARIRVP